MDSYMSLIRLLIYGLIVSSFKTKAFRLSGNWTKNARIKENLSRRSLDDTLLNVAKHGLEQTDDPKHIIIVGAGIAGLTAAKTLKEAGNKVTILEASDRSGGRILTYRDPDGTFHVELGAMRIPSTHRLVMTYIRQFNLTIGTFIEADNNTWYHVNGARHRTSRVVKNPDILGYKTKGDEKGKSAEQLFNEAVKKVFVDCRLQSCLKKYDNYSVKQFLKGEARLSDGAIAMIGDILNERALFYTAFSESVRDQLDISDETQFGFIKGGNDQLPKAFLSTLENDLVRNTRVRKVAYDDKGVRVYIDGSDTPVTGDSVLITATATATSFIKFIPALDSDTQRAIQEIHYDSSTKIILVFKKPFWRKDGISGGRSITDLPVRFIYYPSDLVPSGRGVLLASYTFSDDSQRFAGLTEEQCINHALHDVAVVHGIDVSDLKMIFQNGIVQKWSQNEYSLGAFALFTPYQLRDIGTSVWRPNRRLFFAGEHTYLPHAWIETSIKSALLASLSINAKEYDIVVIGGGPIGLAAAYYSAKRGKNVVVFEKYKFHNDRGSSSGTSRQFRDMYSEVRYSLLAQESVQYWKELENLTGEQCLYQDGYLFFGDPNTGNTTEGNFETIQETCEALQLQCEHLSSDKLKSEFPQFEHYPEFYEGIYGSSSGQVDVNATLRALMQLCHQHNVHLKSKEQVVKIDSNHDGYDIYTQTSMVRAKKIIIAAGPYVNDVIKHLGLHLNLTFWELPSIYFKVNQEKSEESYPTWFYFGRNEHKLFYGFPENSWERPGYVKVCPDFVTEVIHNPYKRTNIPDPVTVRDTVEFVERHMPGLDTCNYQVESKTCLASQLPDGGFVLDFVPQGHQGQRNKNIVIQAGGWAMKFTPLFGKIMADLAVQGATKYDIRKLSITRPGVLVGMGQRQKTSKGFQSNAKDISKRIY